MFDGIVYILYKMILVIPWYYSTTLSFENKSNYFPDLNFQVMQDFGRD